MRRDQDSLAERAYSVMLLNREDPRFSVSTLATDMHISQRSLQRAFADTGTTPRRVLQNLRIELAEELLRSPDYSRLSVDELAFHSGFSSATRLRRALHASDLPNPAVIRARSGTRPSEPMSGSDEDSASASGRDHQAGRQR
jgi:transcriptional regulator GlxA family with amidase domain